jgi:hypothetical protein
MLPAQMARMCRLLLHPRGSHGGCPPMYSKFQSSAPTMSSIAPPRVSTPTLRRPCRSLDPTTLQLLQSVPTCISKIYLGANTTVDDILNRTAAEGTVFSMTTYKVLGRDDFGGHRAAAPLLSLTTFPASPFSSHPPCRRWRRLHPAAKSQPTRSAASTGSSYSTRACPVILG